MYIISFSAPGTHISACVLHSVCVCARVISENMSCNQPACLCAAGYAYYSGVTYAPHQCASTAPASPRCLKFRKGNTSVDKYEVDIGLWQASGVQVTRQDEVLRQHSQKPVHMRTVANCLS